MKEERTAQLEQKIGFVVLLSLLFISLIVMTEYEILSTFLMIILLMIGSGYYSFRMVSKGLLREKMGLHLETVLPAFIVWMALSFLFHDISYPFTLKGLLFQILMFLLFYIPFFFMFQFAFKFSNIQERKQ